MMPATATADTPAAPSRFAGLLAGCVLIVTAMLTSCSSPEQSTEPVGENEIVISDFTYHLPESVPAGAEISIRNEDSVGHTVTSDSSGTFDVVVPPGQTVTMSVPEEAGEYPFHCTPHPYMTATLVVSSP